MRIRALGGATQLAADFEVGIPVAKGRYVEIYPGLTLAHTFGRWVRLDVGLHGAFFIATDDRPHDVGLFRVSTTPIMTEPGFSIRVAFQLSDAFYLGVRTGVTHYSGKQEERYPTTDGRVNVPLGLDFATTINGRRGPVAESWSWPSWRASGCPRRRHRSRGREVPASILRERQRLERRPLARATSRGRRCAARTRRARFENSLR